MKRIHGTSYKVLIRGIKLTLVLICANFKAYCLFCHLDHIVPTSSFNTEYSSAGIDHKFGPDVTS